MGIVAHCPMGHRIKVKDSFAGKKGVCPTCGAKFRIPQLAVAPPASLKTSAQPSTPAPQQQANLPVAAVVSLDQELAVTLPRALALASPGSNAVTVQPGTPQQPSPTPAQEPPEPDVDVLLAADAPAPTAMPASIADAPGALWCVAVPGGTPSSAMSAEAILEWLGSADVTGAELVWRSDWPEWRSIGEVFPDFPPRPPDVGLSWR